MYAAFDGNISLQKKLLLSVFALVITSNALSNIVAGDKRSVKSVVLIVSTNNVLKVIYSLLLYSSALNKL